MQFIRRSDRLLVRCCCMLGDFRRFLVAGVTLSTDAAYWPNCPSAGSYCKLRSSSLGGAVAITREELSNKIKRSYRCGPCHLAASMVGIRTQQVEPEPAGGEEGMHTQAYAVLLGTATSVVPVGSPQKDPMLGPSRVKVPSTARAQYKSTPARFMNARARSTSY